MRPHLLSAALALSLAACGSVPGPTLPISSIPAPTPQVAKPLCPAAAMAPLTAEPLPPAGIDATALSEWLAATFGAEVQYYPNGVVNRCKCTYQGATVEINIEAETDLLTLTPP